MNTTIKVIKTVEEDIQIDLSEPMYVSFLDSIFFRFTPEGSKVMVLYATETSGNLDISTRDYLTGTDIKAIQLAKNYIKISPEAFYSRIRQWLDEENVLGTICETA